MKMLSRLLPGFLTAVASYAFSAPPEIRGTWVTTTGLTSGTSTINTPTLTTANFAAMRNLGLNTIYMDVWRNGFTYYPSPTLAAMTGGPNKAPEIGSRDLLSETLIQSHRNGMIQTGWFQYGFAAKFGNPGTGSTELAKVMQDRGWLLQDQAGAYTNSSNSFSWMNPLVPEVRQFVKGIVLDAVKKYDIDGVQFDDRLAWPIQFGYDNYTRNAYLAETGRQLPTNYNDSLFKAWRASKLTSFAQELIAEVKAIRPDVMVSSAPSVYPFSYDNYCVDWPTWRSAGMFDEFIPQVYRNTAASFDSTWDGAGSMTTGGQVQFMGNRRMDFAAGISINQGSGAWNPWSELLPMVQQVRATNPPVAGHVWWYSDGVLRAYQSQLTAFYDVAGTGQAPRPDLPADWRPPPVVAERDAGNPSLWTLSVPADARYRIIQRVGGTWTEIRSTVYAAGPLQLTFANVDAIELLLDRRPYLPADANLDGLVNIADFSALAANFNLANKLWADGDFTLDRSVTIADFSILAANFNASQARPVPEPCLPALLLFVVSYRRRRVARRELVTNDFTLFPRSPRLRGEPGLERA